MDNKMKVIVVEPEKVPNIKEIDPGLRSLQHEVGGYIEAVYPYEDPVAIICNEEGKINGLPLNRALRDDEGTIYDIGRLGIQKSFLQKTKMKLKYTKLRKIILMRLDLINCRR